jgi:hypothetical protein
MSQFKSKFFVSASVVALLTAGAPAFAQTATDDEPANADAAASVAGGQVVVEQEDATVDVQVPDPDVEVQQGQPVVTVDQPQPEITVSVPEPTVRVEQRAPVITVEQAQPQVTVRIPEPVVTIEIPKPQVDVDTGEPIVDVDQPEPVIRFVRPEPKITVEEAEPNIQVTQSEADVSVDEVDSAEVDIDQAEPEVNVQQSEGADVQVSEAGDPEVNVVPGEEADVNVQQAEARVVLEDFNADEQGNMAEEDRARYAEAVAVLPIFEYSTDELEGRDVYTEGGEDVGEINFIGRRGDTLVAIVGVGGFLGLGERDVAVPVEKMVVREDRIVVPQVTQDQLESLPEYNVNEVQTLEPGLRLADEVNLD